MHSNNAKSLSQRCDLPDCEDIGDQIISTAGAPGAADVEEAVRDGRQLAQVGLSTPAQVKTLGEAHHAAVGVEQAVRQGSQPAKNHSAAGEGVLN